MNSLFVFLNRPFKIANSLFVSDNDNLDPNARGKRNKATAD